jgi:argininosuccinate lyase
MSLAINEMVIDGGKMLKAASDPTMVATDLAEYLVRKGVAFRQAHESVSSLVDYARKQGHALPQLTLGDFRRFHLEFDADVYKLFDPLKSIEAKSSHGSTAPDKVIEAINKSKSKL